MLNPSSLPSAGRPVVVRKEISLLVQFFLLLFSLVWLFANSAFVYRVFTTPTTQKASTPTPAYRGLVPVARVPPAGTKNSPPPLGVDDPYYRLLVNNLVPTDATGRPIPNPLRFHGDIGKDDSGVTKWIPKSKPPIDLNMAKALRQGGGFNLQLSDALPLDRNVTDSRHPDCTRTYVPEQLERASVIIVFYNEPFSTLMRSVHSVLNRTPPELLHEIILVDDGSDMPWISAAGTGELASYVNILNKATQVVLVRNEVRLGIVGARMAGIRAATAPIFVILDSHIEVVSQWLEPLVSRIKTDPRRVVMPQVDGLDPETFETSAGGVGCTLGFLWKLMEHAFDAGPKSPIERQTAKATDFVTSPTMAGGLFAANKDFFMSIGAYDEQYFYWGTENLELSFRLWMCGGILECAPCSRVYHIFRKGGVGYSSPDSAVTKNKMRLLTIWMDEYADLAWRVLGQPRIDFGTYEENRKWRVEHECKSFQWFLESVNPESDVLQVPRDVPYLGTVKNLDSNLCVDTLGNDTPGAAIGLSSCHGGRTQQFMYFRIPHHIMPVSNDESCIGQGSDAAKTGWCHADQQMFQLIETSDGSSIQLRNLALNKCLGGTMEGKVEYLNCDSTDRHQQWEWSKYNPPATFTPPPPPRLRGQMMMADG